MFLEKNSFKTEPTCQPPSKVIPPFFFFFFLSFFLFCAHIMSYVNYVSKAWDGCACVHMKQLYSLHKRTVKVLTPISNMDYKQKYSALKLLPIDKQLFLNNNKKLNVFYFKKSCSRQSLAVPERSHDSF